MDNNTELENSSESHEDANLDNQAPDFSEWDTDTFKEKYGELDSKNKQLYARTKKAETEAKRVAELEAELSKYKQPETKKPAKVSKEDDLASLRRELHETRLKQQFPDLSMEDVRKAMAYAKAEDSDPAELINSDFFQAYVGSRREKAEQENATPNPKGRSGSSTPDWDNLSADQIRDLPAKEYEKYQEYKSGNSKGGNFTVRTRTAL